MRKSITSKQILAILICLLKFPTCLYSQINFSPYQITPTGSSAEVVTIGDLNGDGLNDVVLGNGYHFGDVNDFTLLIYYQNANGSLNTPEIYEYPHAAFGISSITMGDFNNDLLMDLVIGYTDSIGLIYQNISGSFDPCISIFCGNDVNDIKPGDFNNDGLTDLVVSLWTSSSILVFYQTANGFTNQSIFKPQSGFDEVDVGDVNGDGKDDVIYMLGALNTGLRVYLQNTNGTLNYPVTYNLPPNVLEMSGIAVADLNNDNEVDVVASCGGNGASAKVVIWFQDPITHLLQTPIEIPAYETPEPIEVADLNCDGKNEIVVVHGGWEKMSVYEQNISGLYTSYNLFPITYASHYNPEGLALGDINNDGKIDAAIADYNYGLILLLNSSSSNCIPTSIEANEIDNSDIKIWPNPFSSHVNIHFANYNLDESVDVLLQNAMGKIIRESKIVPTSTEINLNNLDKGFYFLTFTSLNKKVNKKLIKF